MGSNGKVCMADLSRRQTIKALTVAAGVAGLSTLPKSWESPIINASVVAEAADISPVPTATNTAIPPTATKTAVPPTPTATSTPVPPAATNPPAPPTATAEEEWDGPR